MVSRSVGPPTLSRPAKVESPSTMASKMLRCTTARVGAVQICPEWNAQVEPMAVMAALMSASSKTTAAPLPPSSISSRFMVGAPAAAIRCPTVVEPVNDTMSTSGEEVRAEAGSGPWALIRFTTPGGKPTSSRTRASSTTASGSWGAGLMTTVFPMPKGVILTHGNLVANTISSTAVDRFTTDDISLSWMPLTHDMGLIGFYLMQFANRVHINLMPTELFVRRPLLWLQTASKKHATITCSPNFGYRHFLKVLGDRKLEGVDLSSIRLIYNGAEPISVELCNEFMDTDRKSTRLN